MQHSFFLHENVQIQQKFTFESKKPSFTWLLAAILIMTETDIECGHTKKLYMFVTLTKVVKLLLCLT